MVKPTPRMRESVWRLPAIQTAMADAGIAAINDGKTRYTPGAGIPELRDVIAEHYRNRYGVSFEREETPFAARRLRSRDTYLARVGG